MSIQAIKTKAIAVMNSCVTYRFQVADMAREKKSDIQVLDIAELVAQFL